MKTAPVRSYKLITLAAIICMVLFSAVVYTSCKKAEFDPCGAVNCLNGGNCVRGACVCPGGYSGKQCETHDFCYGVNCLNGGTCVGGICTCPTGYEGQNCEIESRSRFIGAWYAADYNTDTLKYMVGISAGASADAVVISNSFANGVYSIGQINASVTGARITIPKQNPDGNRYSVTGSGTYANGQIDWTYYLKDDSTGQAIYYTGIWHL
jgi:hypothetical protein